MCVSERKIWNIFENVLSVKERVDAETIGIAWHLHLRYHSLFKLVMWHLTLIQKQPANNETTKKE